MKGLDWKSLTWGAFCAILGYAAHALQPQLLCAMRIGPCDVAKQMLWSGIDGDVRTLVSNALALGAPLADKRGGYTPLIEAASKSKCSMVQFLAEQIAPREDRADLLEQQVDNGETALFIAAAKCADFVECSDRMVTSLLAAGAQPAPTILRGPEEYRGWTPLKLVTSGVHANNPFCQRVAKLLKAAVTPG